MIIHIREEISEFRAGFVDDGATAKIRFLTASDHEAELTIPRDVLEQLTAHLTGLIAQGEEAPIERNIPAAQPDREASVKNGFNPLRLFGK